MRSIAEPAERCFLRVVRDMPDRLEPVQIAEPFAQVLVGQVTVKGPRHDGVEGPLSYVSGVHGVSENREIERADSGRLRRDIRARHAPSRPLHEPSARELYLVIRTAICDGRGVAVGALTDFDQVGAALQTVRGTKRRNSGRYRLRQAPNHVSRREDLSGAEAPGHNRRAGLGPFLPGTAAHAVCQPGQMLSAGQAFCAARKAVLGNRRSRGPRNVRPPIVHVIPGTISRTATENVPTRVTIPGTIDIELPRSKPRTGSQPVFAVFVLTNTGGQTEIEF
jgi:hypothetical protein